MMISDKYILIFRKNTNYRKNMDIVIVSNDL